MKFKIGHCINIENYSTFTNRYKTTSMRLINKLLLAITLLFSLSVSAQKTGAISGQIIDKQTQQPIANTSISFSNNVASVVSNELGKFRLNQIPTGSYTIKFTSLGYNTITLFNVLITSGNENTFLVELEPMVTELKGITVTNTGRKTAKAASLETPLSVQRLTTEEIKRNPGSNFDISRVIQSLPGVGGTASTAGFRNDIVIRGGAPNENVYYLDGIEVPVINHFATQGSAGGPAGILNVSFIEDV